MKLRRGKISILIVPEEEGEPRNFRVSRWLIRFFIWIGVVFLGLLVFCVVTYVLMVNKLLDYNQVTRENKRLTEENRKIVKLAEEVEKLEAVKQKIQQAMGSSLGIDSTLDTTKLHLTDFSEDISPAREAKKIEITFQLPVEGTISQDFNEGIFPHRCHNGVDIAVPEGTLINATSDGWIVFNGWHQRYGNLLIIQHPNDYLSFYGHNQSILVEVGEKVRMGQPVAVSGNSGQSSAPHLHFEIRCRGKTIDPATLIPALKEENLNTDKTINPR